MMHLSSLPILIIVIFGFLTFLTLGIQRFNRLESISLYMLLIILLVWGGCSGYLASTGVYVSIDFLQLAPGYWLPYIPVITTVILVLLITPLQNALRKFVDHVPDLHILVQSDH